MSESKKKHQSDPPAKSADLSLGSLSSKRALAAALEALERDMRNPFAHEFARQLTPVTLGGVLGNPLAQRSVPSPREEELQRAIADLRAELTQQQREFAEAKSQTGEYEKELKRAQQTLEELLVKERLNFILSRIHQDAKPALFESEPFRNKFLKEMSCTAYVMSVDIRRSTELMLKSRSPELYAQFITDLCLSLRDIIIGHQGVFDKFTGDGILAFFPEFYSGEDAGFLAVMAAEKSHRLFNGHYAKSRSCFITVLKDVGLGIGIDYGATHLVQIGDGLTVVGTPVVYACRMSGGPAGSTLLNQPCFEQLFSRFSAYCTFEEAQFEAKHEGPHLAYLVNLNGKPYDPNPPGWYTFRDAVEPS